MEKFYPQGLDIDFFCVDKMGNVAHLASGGGDLPSHLVQNISMNEKVRDFVLALPVTDIRTGAGDKSFKMFAERGLFSYDKNDLTNPSDSIFKLMYTPLMPIHCSLFPLQLSVYLRSLTISQTLGCKLIDIRSLLS